MPDTGGYEQFRVLSRSPSGLTYRARAERLGGDIVMRIYPTELGAPGPAEQFTRQMRQLSEIRGRGLVTPVEVGRTEAGAPYMTRRYVNGPSLENLVPVASNDTEAWTGQVAWFGSRIGHAVEALHERGIIHGSLRPTNVFVTGVGSLHITDVVPWAAWTANLAGVARHPDHVAPEVLEGAAPDRDADVFSIASVLRSLVGQEVINHLPGHLVMLFDEALDRRPGRRPPLIELISAFDEVAEGHDGFEMGSPTALPAARPQPALAPAAATVAEPTPTSTVTGAGAPTAIPVDVPAPETTGSGRILSLVRRLANVRRRTTAAPRRRVVR